MPGLFDYEGLAALLRQVDFQQTVLEGMLAFLLFAGALHVDVVSLRSRALTIGTMASLGKLCFVFDGMVPRFSRWRIGGAGCKCSHRCFLHFHSHSVYRF